MTSPVIAVHGGAGRTPADDEPTKTEALEQARARAEEFLANEDDEDAAVNAVVEAVRYLESTGLFSAGKGGDPQSDGRDRYDASLMSSDGRAGAVIAVSRVNSAILGARAIHQHVHHSCVVGPPADEVCGALGVELRDLPSLELRPVSECVAKYLEAQDGGGGTVGAIALGRNGILAAATSTSGFSTALPGRAGDSGALGVGTLASKRCAVSCTGDGDFFLLTGLAARIDSYLEVGVSLADAVERGMASLVGAKAWGGFIVLSADGQLVRARNVAVLRAAGSVPFIEYEGKL